MANVEGEIHTVERETTKRERERHEVKVNTHTRRDRRSSGHYLPMANEIHYSKQFKEHWYILSFFRIILNNPYICSFCVGIIILLIVFAYFETCLNSYCHNKQNNSQYPYINAIGLLSFSSVFFGIVQHDANILMSVIVYEYGSIC